MTTVGVNGRRNECRTAPFGGRRLTFSPLPFSLNGMGHPRSSLLMRWVSVVSLAPLLLLVLLGAEQSAIRCSVTGLLAPRPCCAKAETPVAGDRGPDVLRAPSCCERVSQAAGQMPGSLLAQPVASADEHASDGVGHQIALLALAPSAAVAAADDVREHAEWRVCSSGPPRRAAASFLLRHSFLI